ncbi:MAG TPA: MarR family transcriptional regulator [Tepidisphaeraceae bacterium]|nr:MarR family transcriptional regulator [Tepidisphaeraceae bacterium]
MSTLPTMSRAIKGHTVSGDGPQEQSFRALIRAMGLLDRVMQPYFAKFGLSGAKWGTLRALHRAEQEGHQGLRMTELSERLLVRPPSVTGVIDRLERSGWVTRDAAPEDLRAKQVRLTSEGRKLVDRVVAVHSDQIAKVMAGLNQHEQFELYQLLGRLSEHLEGII